MSHTLYPLRRQRLQRSELAVPASNPTMIDKAAEGPADYVFLDLEDAVAPPEKDQARRNAVQALNDADLRRLGRLHSVAEARAAFGTSDTARTLAETAPDNLASLLSFFDRRPVSRTAIRRPVLTDPVKDTASISI